MEKLEEVLDLNPIPEKPKAVAASKAVVPEVLEPIVLDEVPTDKDVDFNLARQNIKLVIMQGEEALDGILELARQGEHPRAYEVAGQIVKTLVDANKDLMNLHKLKQEGEPKKVAEQPKTVNNTVFVGTTAELQQLVRKAREEGE